MPSHRDSPFEVGVAAHEKRVQAVHFHAHFIHDGLAVGGAVVEQDVEQRFIGEVPQATNARQSDFLYVPGNTESLEARKALKKHS